MAEGKPVVIDFWAEWCGPCRMVGPIIDELAEEYGDKVTIGKCDVDSCDDIVAQYRVRNIPTVVFVKGGEVVDKVVGATSKDTLKSKIDAMLQWLPYYRKKGYPERQPFVVIYCKWFTRLQRSCQHNFSRLQRPCKYQPMQREPVLLEYEINPHLKYTMSED